MAVALDRLPGQGGEADALQRARDGDEGALLQLLERYEPMLRSVARRYFLPNGEREDLVQEAMIGFLKAVRDFRVELGLPFRPFAELCATRQIITAVKGATRLKHAPLNRAVSLQRPCGEDGALTLEDLLCDQAAESPEDRLLRLEESSALAEAIHVVLSPYERQVIGHYLTGMTFQEIALACGTHAKSVDNALWRVKTKLRRHFTGVEA